MVYCFRLQCGPFNNAINEAKYFHSADELKDYAAQYYDLGYSIPDARPIFTGKDVTLKKLNIDDARVGWTNCAYVVIDGIIIGCYGEKDE